MSLDWLANRTPSTQGTGSRLTFDNHDSVNGIRDFARGHGRHGGLRAHATAGDRASTNDDVAATWTASNSEPHHLFAYRHAVERLRRAAP